MTTEGWNANGPRRIKVLGDTYYIICRRHTCSAPTHRPFTFLAYDPEVVTLMPECVQEQLPAFLTRKWAVDKSLHRLVGTRNLTACLLRSW